jgi:hypothetical protein
MNTTKTKLKNLDLLSFKQAETRREQTESNATWRRVSDSYGNRSCMSCGLKLEHHEGDVCPWCYTGSGVG